jgi:hypothetical protein
VTYAEIVLEGEVQALGFTTHWVPMDAVQRAPSLVAERRGTRGKRVLLIGHMDTVFELSMISTSTLVTAVKIQVVGSGRFL